MIPHVLLVENDHASIEILKETVLSLGYSFEMAVNAEIALSMLKENKFQLLVTSYHLPDMRGDELIRMALRESHDVLCIIFSPIEDLPTLIPFLNEHLAYFFIVKPIASDLLSDRLVKAMDVWQMRSKLKYLEKNEQSYYQQALDIFDWKKSMQTQNFESFGSKIIRQLNISLFHGGGIGGMLTMLSLVFSKAKKNPDSGKIEISENQFNLLKENYEMSQILIQGLTRAQTILMDNSPYTKMIPGSLLIQYIEEIKVSLQEMLKIKNQKIVISSMPKMLLQKNIFFDVNIMDSVMKELLINAMKYSNDSDVIFIIFFGAEASLDIKIINPAYPNVDGTIGISEDKEIMLYEPFFRLSTVSHEGYTMEEFGAGIGLTVVKKIVDRHKADINIITINNYQGMKSKKDISVTLRFPFLRNN